MFFFYFFFINCGLCFLETQQLVAEQLIFVAPGIVQERERERERERGRERERL